MKKHQIIGSLCCLAALSSCQQMATDMSISNTDKKATIIAPNETECAVVKDVLDDKFVSYQLQFDTNNNNIPDTELCVCADVTNAKRKDIKSYIRSIKSLPVETKSMDEWQYQVTSHPALGPRTEAGFYFIRELIQHTK